MSANENNRVFKTELGNFELLYNHKDAFDLEMFLSKYIEVLDNKNFIVGDIAYDKLRLTGFVLTKNANNDKNVNFLEDFILEYCNIGCPFYVLKNLNKQ